MSARREAAARAPQARPASPPAEAAAARPGPLNPLVSDAIEYPFVRLERRRRELAPAGVTSLNFSIGDPREETPEFIRDALRRAVPAMSSYPTVAGLPSCAPRSPPGPGAASA